MRMIKKLACTFTLIIGCHANTDIQPTNKQEFLALNGPTYLYATTDYKIRRNYLDSGSILQYAPTYSYTENRNGIEYFIVRDQKSGTRGLVKVSAVRKFDYKNPKKVIYITRDFKYRGISFKRGERYSFIRNKNGDYLFIYMTKPQLNTKIMKYESDNISIKFTKEFANEHSIIDITEKKVTKHNLEIHYDYQPKLIKCFKGKKVNSLNKTNNADKKGEINLITKILGGGLSYSKGELYQEGSMFEEEINRPYNNSVSFVKVYDKYISMKIPIMWIRAEKLRLCNNESTAKEVDKGYKYRFTVFTAINKDKLDLKMLTNSNAEFVSTLQFNFDRSVADELKVSYGGSGTPVRIQNIVEYDKLKVYINNTLSGHNSLLNGGLTNIIQSVVEYYAVTLQIKLKP